LSGYIGAADVAVVAGPGVVDGAVVELPPPLEAVVEPEGVVGFWPDAVAVLAPGAAEVDTTGVLPAGAGVDPAAGPLELVGIVIELGTCTLLAST